jgi:ABC-type multidrug transport system fused ATPase/permease subunit
MANRGVIVPCALGLLASLLEVYGLMIIFALVTNEPNALVIIPTSLLNRANDFSNPNLLFYVGSVAFILSKSLVLYWCYVELAKNKAQFQVDLQSKLFGALRTLPIAKIERVGSSGWGAVFGIHLINYVRAYEAFIRLGINAIMIPAYIFFSATSLNLGFGFLLLLTPIIYYYFRSITSRIDRFSRERVQEVDRFQQYIRFFAENSVYVRVAKFDLLPTERTENLIQRLKKIEVTLGRLLAVTAVSKEPIFLVFTLAVMLIEGVNSTTIASIGGLIFVFFRLYGYGYAVLGNFQSVRQEVGSIDRINSILTETKDSKRHHTLVGKSLGADKIKSIVVDRVMYQYCSGNSLVLNFDKMEFCLGRLNVIVGKSGSGKTTLLDLLMNVRVPLSGKIYVNGNPERTLMKFGPRIGFVPQIPVFFQGTLRDNLLDGRDLIDTRRFDEVLLKLSKRGTSELVDMLDLSLSEGATNISIGQRQRFAVARELIRDLDILILDEPTSALDSDSNAALLQLIKELSTEILTIVVTHDKEIINMNDINVIAI